MNRTKVTQDLESQLMYAYEKGIDLYLDGELSSPSVIIDRFLREDSVYMADFVMDDAGELSQIRCDCIEKC